jgi:hypothetical protein
MDDLMDFVWLDPQELESDLILSLWREFPLVDATSNRMVIYFIQLVFVSGKMLFIHSLKA